MRIAFWPSGCLPFDAKSLDERPLGGIETGVIRLSQALADLGHEVLVLGQLDKPRSSDKVIYLSYSAIRDLGKLDIFIAVREWEALLLPIQTKRKLFWTGDSYDQIQNLGIGDPRVSALIDCMLCVSDWQARTLSEASGFPKAKAINIGNGVNLEYFSGNEVRFRKRLIYSSTPYRGLKYLANIYSDILKKHPDAELHVFSGYAVYANGAGLNYELEREFEQIKKLLSTIPNCYLHGNVLQSKLAREFMRSAILAYPNTFAETSCITALEAQAAGCAIVTSAKAALPETVADAGILIPGEPGTLEYHQAFVDALDRILSDDVLFDTLSNNGLRRAKQHYDWKQVAQRLLSSVNV